MKFCCLDFEYNQSKHEHPRILCVAWSVDSETIQSAWLDDDPTAFRKKLKELIAEDYIFVAYQAIAEARCFLGLGIDPTKVKWIDLHLEDKQITNSFNRWGYGKQLVKANKNSDAKIKTTHNINKYDIRLDARLEKLDRSKPQRNLAAFVYRLTGELIDTQEKKDTVGLIVSRDDGEFTEDEKKKILKYCESDIAYLRTCLEKIFLFYRDYFKVSNSTIFSWMLKRGEFAAHSAVIESRGHPVAVDDFLKFNTVSAEILKECQLDIMRQFPGDYCPFKQKQTGKYKGDVSMNLKNIAAWIKEKSGHYDDWLRTEKGNISVTKEEAWRKFYAFKHLYPEGNYAAQLLRYNSVKRSLNGFMPGSKRSILDSFSDRDGRVRYYANIYGSQTGRSQPGSTDCLALKARWARVLINPNSPGRVICGIDYSSQEILIQAILAGDEALYDSYASGDVYLDFGKRVGEIPKQGTKKTHGDLRDIFKVVVLSSMFGMGAKSQSIKLTNDLGKPFQEHEAQRLIDMFKNTYWKTAEWRERLMHKYNAKGYLMLPSGWALGPDNKADTSVKNFPVQGGGSDILREAVKLSHADNLRIVLTLHDALYQESATFDAENEMHRLDKAMKQAFINVMQHDWAKAIRTDSQIWGDDIDIPGAKCQPRYIDEGSFRDLLFFGKHFFKLSTLKEVTDWVRGQGWID